MEDAEAAIDDGLGVKEVYLKEEEVGGGIDWGGRRWFRCSGSGSRLRDLGSRFTIGADGVVPKPRLDDSMIRLRCFPS